jgi:hypothetical protein
MTRPRPCDSLVGDMPTPRSLALRGVFIAGSITRLAALTGISRQTVYHVASGLPASLCTRLRLEEFVLREERRRGPKLGRPARPTGLAPGGAG